MDEFRVRDIVRDELEKRSPFTLGNILLGIVIFAAILYGVRLAANDYRDLKERVEKLEK